MDRTTTQGIGRTEAAGGPAERAAATGAADLGQWCAAGLRNLSLAVELGRAMLEMHRRLMDVGRETIRRQQDAAAMAEMARALAGDRAPGSAAGGGAYAELARSWVEALQTVAAATSGFGPRAGGAGTQASASADPRPAATRQRHAA